jgi:hypothetical protein
MAHVTLRISGLVVLRFKDKICQVGILDEAPADHAFLIQVTRKTPNKSYKPKRVVIDLPSLKQIAPLDLSVISGTNPPPVKGAVSRQAGTGAKSFDKVLDFEKLHQGKPLSLQPRKLAPLRIRQGKFYALELVECELEELPKTGRRATGPRTPLGKLAEAVGVDINLKAGETQGRLVITGQNRFRKTFNLDLSEPGTRYEVDLLNAPLEAALSPHHNHFEVYYRALKVAPPKYRVHLHDHASHGITPLSKLNPPCIVSQVSSEGELPAYP